MVNIHCINTNGSEEEWKEVSAVSIQTGKGSEVAVSIQAIKKREVGLSREEVLYQCKRAVGDDSGCEGRIE